MEGKVLLQDLASSLANKRDLQHKVAERFVKAFFETIREGILSDQNVKIKGLGTFKMIEVQERESVNVNTGERIVIPGHSKITFTPDNEMKDEVNKPFALFQTVMINDATPMEEMERMDATPVPDEVVQETENQQDSTEVEASHQQDEAEAAPQQQEPIVMPRLAELDELSVNREEAEEPQSPEEPEGVQDSDETETNAEEQSDNETAITAEVNEEPVDDTPQPAEEKAAPQAAYPQTEPQQEEKKPSRWSMTPGRALLIFFFWTGLIVSYFIGRYNWMNINHLFNTQTEKPVIMTDTVYVEKAAPLDSAFVRHMEDSLRKVIQDEFKASNKQQAQPQQQAQAKPATKQEKLSKSVSGAYEIVGYKGTRTIGKGDYLLRIVRDEYGNDDALRYVISYNDFKNPNNLPIGTVVRLPKLKAK